MDKNNLLNNLEILINKESILREEDILRDMPLEKHNDWHNYMIGKTCPLLDNNDLGVYRWDLDSFLQKYGI
jgi:hypothetical protein